MASFVTCPVRQSEKEVWTIFTTSITISNIGKVTRCALLPGHASVPLSAETCHHLCLTVSVVPFALSFYQRLAGAPGSHVLAGAGSGNRTAPGGGGRSGCVPALPLTLSSQRPGKNDYESPCRLGIASHSPHYRWPPRSGNMRWKLQQLFHTDCGRRAGNVLLFFCPSEEENDTARHRCKTKRCPRTCLKSKERKDCGMVLIGI